MVEENPSNNFCDRLQAEKRVDLAKDASEHALEDHSQRDFVGGRLPVELCRKIFRHCLPTDPTPEDFHRYHEYSTTTPTRWKDAASTRLRLGAVAHHWRELLWADPLLWQFVPIILRSETPRARTELVQEWLDRSKGLPLTVWIANTIGDFGSETIEQPDAHLLLALAKVIAPQLRRCTAFYANSPSFVSLLHSEAGSKPLPMKALILESVVDVDHEFGIFKNEGMFAVGALPSPTFASISAYFLAQVHIRYDNITNFVGKHLRIDECATIVRESRQLVECVFDSVEPPFDAFPPSSTTTATSLSLRCLELWYCDMTLLDSLILPALEEFDCMVIEDTVTRHLERLIRRSGCRLKRLSNNGNTIEVDEEIISLLQATPSLEELRWGNRAGEQFFEWFVGSAYWENGTRGTFLPNLQVFYYGSRKLFPWSVLHSLAPVHPSETNVGRPLRSITFDVSFGGGESLDTDIANDMIERVDLDEILYAISQGVEFHVEYEGLELIEIWAKHYGLWKNGRIVLDEEEEDDAIDSGYIAETVPMDVDD